MRAMVTVLMAYALGAAAEVTVYRVVDAEGHVSFSDRPPTGAVAEELKVDADPPAASPEVAERQAAMRELGEKLRQERLAREAGLAAAPPSTSVQQHPAERFVEERWLPLYYPAYAPRPPWHRPPPRPAPLPQPNPDSLSPRGLQQRLQDAR